MCLFRFAVSSKQIYIDASYLERRPLLASENESIHQHPIKRALKFYQGLFLTIAIPLLIEPFEFDERVQRNEIKGILPKGFSWPGLS